MRKKAETLEKTPGFAEWVQSILAAGKIKSERQWAIAAGYSPSAINAMLKNRRASVDAVIALADVVGEPRGNAFLAMGWLRPGDLTTYATTNLTQTDKKLIEHSRQLPPDELRVLMKIAQGLKQRVDDPESDD